LLIAAGLILTITSGCKWSFWQIDKPVYVGPGQKAEVAKDADVRVWVTNKETGKRELRIVEVKAGWWVARPKEAEVKPAEVVSEVK
jgi:hypothetical protein